MSATVTTLVRLLMGALVMAFFIVLMVACSPATRDRTDWAGISQAMKEKRHDW